MSVHTIPCEKATALTHDRVIEILSTHLPGVLDAQFGRNASDVTSDGIFLPDPGTYYRQDAPSGQDLKGVQEVEVYQGQRSSSDYSDFATVTSGGRVGEVEIPWQVTVLFGQAPGQTVSDPVQSRDLEAAEIAGRRADYYVGGLKYCLSERGIIGTSGQPRDHAIRDTEEGGDLSATVDIRVNEDDDKLIGTGSFEFTIEQRQILPPRQK